MVSKHAVYFLLDAVIGLSYVRERAISAADPPFVRIEVKGTGLIFEVLLRAYENVVRPLSTSYKKMEKPAEDLQKWILYLDKKHEETTTLFSNKNILNQNDAKKLKIDVENWIQTIVSLYTGSDTKYIDEIAFYQIPNNLQGIDEITQKDIRDGIDAIANELPTPAVMILCRSVERVLQKYYTRITSQEVGKKNLGAMIRDLEGIQYKDRIKKSLLAYLHYINEERINADHPYKRFSQKESEEILHQIVKAIEIISSELKSTQN